jgi:hypothetical protein
MRSHVSMQETYGCAAHGSVFVATVRPCCSVTRGSSPFKQCLTLFARSVKEMSSRSARRRSSLACINLRVRGKRRCPCSLTSSLLGGRGPAQRTSTSAHGRQHPVERKQLGVALANWIPYADERQHRDVPQLCPKSRLLVSGAAGGA